MNKIFRKKDHVVIMNMETAQKLIITDKEDIKKDDISLLEKYSNSVSKSINNRV